MSAFGTPEEAARAIALAGERAAAFRRDVGDLPAAVVLGDEERARYRTPLPRSGVGLEAAIERVAQRGAAALALALPRALVPVHRRLRARGGRRSGRAGRRARRQPRRRRRGAASEVEDVAWRWLAELIGFPAGIGHFTSGGTHANLTGLACARARALPAAREHGVAPGSAAVYASEQAHNSIARACDVLGLGRRALRPIRTDDAVPRARPTSWRARSRPIAQPA